MKILHKNLNIKLNSLLVILVPGLMGASASNLYAQEAAAIIEEIIVTSTRRAMRLQDTGAPVSAFTDEAMNNRMIRTFEDLNKGVSGLHIATYQGESSVFIRGIGTPIIVAGNDSSAGTYLDGVFLSRASAIGPAFFDIERVEVLKGPQGTLYGRNATSGAVNIITKDPTEEFVFESKLTLGNYEQKKLFGVVSGSLTDGVRGRLAVQAENRDGFTTGRGPDNKTIDLEDKDDIAVRLKLQADIIENASFTLTGDYYKADDKALVYHAGSSGYQEEIPGWLNTREGAQALAYFAWKNAGRASQPASRDIFVDAPYFNETEIWGVTAKLDWDVKDYNLQLISNYKDSFPHLQNEFDLSDAYVNVYERGEDHWQWSFEGLVSSPEESRFRWVAGAYYFEEENKVINHVFGDFWEPILTAGLGQLVDFGVIPPIDTNIPLSPFCCDLRLNGTQETEAWAVYLDTSFDLTEKLTIKLGARHSSEKRDAFQNFSLLVLSPNGGDPIQFAPNPLLFPASVSNSREGVVPDPFGFVVAPVEGPDTFDSFTPKLGIEFRLSPDVLLYALAERGFKSGGYNIGSTQRDSFKPEKIWNYEAGIKSEFFNQRVLLNASFFHYDYENLQAQDSVNNQTIIHNVGEAKVDGVELEFKLSLHEQFQIDGSVTYLDARFTEGELTEPLRPAPLSDPAGSFVRDLDGLNLTRAPEWKTVVGAQFNSDAGNFGDLMVRVDYARQSKVYFTVFNIDAASQESYGLLSARARIAGKDGHWAVTLFGENLTDEEYFTNLVLAGAAYGAEFFGPLGSPRTYGAEFSYTY